MAKKDTHIRFDPKLLKRINEVRSASSAPSRTWTDWVEQACYERVLREEKSVDAAR
jgi:hypothetical protein